MLNFSASKLILMFTFRGLVARVHELNVTFFKKPFFLTKGDMDHKVYVVGELDKCTYLTIISIYRHACGEIGCLEWGWKVKYSFVRSSY